jgi:hypothetical protein
VDDHGAAARSVDSAAAGSAGSAGNDLNATR